jgi:hypothetical protein
MIRVILHSEAGLDTGLVKWSGYWSGGMPEIGLAIKDMSVIICVECVIIRYDLRVTGILCKFNCMFWSIN